MRPGERRPAPTAVVLALPPPPTLSPRFPRAGTTHLHNMMSRDTRWRPLFQMDAMFPMNGRIRARVEMWIQAKVTEFLDPQMNIAAVGGGVSVGDGHPSPRFTLALSNPPPTRT